MIHRCVRCDEITEAAPQNFIKPIGLFVCDRCITEADERAETPDYAVDLADVLADLDMRENA